MAGKRYAVTKMHPFYCKSKYSDNYSQGSVFA